MRSVLVYVDGSAAAEAAVRCVVANARAERIATIHLLNVQPPLDGYVRRFIARTAIRGFQRDSGDAALAGAQAILDEAELAYTRHIEIGSDAETIVARAAELGVDEIVLGADGLGLFDRLMFHALARRVVRAANRPVIIVKSRMRQAWPAPAPTPLRPILSR